MAGCAPLLASVCCVVVVTSGVGHVLVVLALFHAADMYIWNLCCLCVGLWDHEAPLKGPPGMWLHCVELMHCSEASAVGASKHVV